MVEIGVARGNTRHLGSRLRVVELNDAGGDVSHERHQRLKAALCTSIALIDGEHFLFSFVQNFTCLAAFWRQCIGNDAVAYGNELAQYRLVMHDFRISADIRGRGRAPHQFGEIRQPARIVLNPL